MNKLYKVYDKYNVLKQKRMDTQRIINEKPSPDYVKLHFQQLKTHHVLKNLFFEKLEGNQAKKYRQSFGLIANDLRSTKFYIHMKKVIDLLNEFMSIAGRTCAEISDGDIDKAKDIILKFDEQWAHSKKILGIHKTLGAKQHYLYHAIEYMYIWKIPLGYISEQSVESFKKCVNQYSTDIKDKEEYSN